MSKKKPISLPDLVRHLGRYPEEAFLFVREGLGFAVEYVHGPETDAHRCLHQYLLEHDLDVADLQEQFVTGLLPDAVQKAIRAAGGPEKLNRHVTGRDLCWSLRKIALRRWGMLARTVLESWNVQSTQDFGRIVFGFIEFELMRKQPQDSMEDFDEVFSFDEAFDAAFPTGLADVEAEGETP